MGGSAAPNPLAGLAQRLGQPAASAAGPTQPGPYQANPTLSGIYGPQAMPNYTGAFQSALNSARSNIQQQLGTALNDIAGNQQHAQAALGALGPTEDAMNAAVNGGNASANASLAGALKTAGAGGLAGGNQYGANGPLQSLGQMMTPDQSAFAATQALNKENIPLLGQGIAQMTQQERAAAQEAALGQQGSLDQLQAQFAQQQQLQAMQEQAAQQQAQQNFGYQQQLNNQQNAAQQKLLAEQLAGSSSTTPATGAFANTGFSQQQITDAQNSPQYQRFSQAIAGNQLNPQTISQLLSGQGAKGQALLTVLMQKFPSYFSAGNKNLNMQAKYGNDFMGKYMQNVSTGVPIPGLNP